MLTGSADATIASAGIMAGAEGIGTFSENVAVAAHDLSVDVAHDVDMVAQTVQLDTVDRAALNVPGARVELSEEGQDGMHYQPFAWRATAAFSQWRNVLPAPVANVEELLMRAPSSAARPRAVVATAGTIAVALNDVMVWSTGVQSHEFSPDALRVRFASTTVSSIALSGNGARYVDCRELVIHRVVDPATQGAVRAAAASTVDFVAPTEVRLAANTVLLNAQDTAKLFAAESVGLDSGSVDVIASELDLRTVDGSAHIVSAEGTEVVVGNEVSMQMASSAVQVARMSRELGCESSCSGYVGFCRGHRHVALCWGGSPSGGRTQTGCTCSWFQRNLLKG